MKNICYRQFKIAVKRNYVYCFYFVVDWFKSFFGKFHNKLHLSQYFVLFLILYARARIEWLFIFLSSFNPKSIWKLRLKTQTEYKMKRSRSFFTQDQCFFSSFDRLSLSSSSLLSLLMLSTLFCFHFRCRLFLRTFVS